MKTASIRRAPAARRRWAALAGLGALMAAALPAGDALAQGSPTLAAIRARGAVVCGVQSNNPPFSLPDSRGEWRGIDVDSCRALAAAAILPVFAVLLANASDHRPPPPVEPESGSDIKRLALPPGEVLRGTVEDDA